MSSHLLCKCNPTHTLLLHPNPKAPLPIPNNKTNNVTHAQSERCMYTMEKFLEVLSLQEQTVEIKRKQRAAAAGAAGFGTCSQEDMREMKALQEKKAAFEKKWREAIADPNVRRPTVIELFGELHYSESLPTSPPLATFSPGESSGSLSREVRGSGEERRDPNHVRWPSFCWK
ncbi:unnamed protein product [Cuscuta campestris]|uniref:Uncharacterized protein n=1 Tax=Cuscuta campestris TaxID=132261 RepID=A0A484KBT1_9ASTE|nr:unnamed protein product [Cuscuta campestris]